MRFVMRMTPAEHDAGDDPRLARYGEELDRAGVLVACTGAGGSWMIQVKSWAEAIVWACRCPATSGDVIEVCRILEH